MGLTPYYEQAIFKSIRIKYVSFVIVKARINTEVKKVTGRFVNSTQIIEF